jgi:hypothetical protein
MRDPAALAYNLVLAAHLLGMPAAVVVAQATTTMVDMAAWVELEAVAQAQATAHLAAQALLEPQAQQIPVAAGAAVMDQILPQVLVALE